MLFINEKCKWIDANKNILIKKKDICAINVASTL